MIDYQDDESSAGGAAATEAPPCPKCSGPMWDNREGKRNPKAPDFKCKDRNCDGVIWPPRTANAGAAAAAGAGATAGAATVTPPAEGSPACPICGGAMWDDRASKRNPKAPDFKCKNKPKMRGGPGCEGVIWPPRDGQRSAYGSASSSSSSSSGASATTSARPRSGGAPSPYQAPRDYGPPPMNDAPPHDDDDLPF